MKNKTKLLFVCLGNICRSPAAEGIFISYLREQGTIESFEIDSAGLNGYHNGEFADARMRNKAGTRGYKLESISRQVKAEDFDYFDMIIGMDNSNIQGLLRLAGDNADKIYKMTDFCQYMDIAQVPDPYYGGDSGFDHVLDILEDASVGLYKFITDRYGKS